MIFILDASLRREIKYHITFSWIQTKTVLKTRRELRSYELTTVAYLTNLANLLLSSFYFQTNFWCWSIVFHLSLDVSCFVNEINVRCRQLTQKQTRCNLTEMKLVERKQEPQMCHKKTSATNNFHEKTPPNFTTCLLWKHYTNNEEVKKELRKFSCKTPNLNQPQRLIRELQNSSVNTAINLCLWNSNLTNFNYTEILCFIFSLTTSSASLLVKTSFCLDYLNIQSLKHFSSTIVLSISSASSSVATLAKTPKKHSFMPLTVRMVWMDPSNINTTLI